MCVLNLLLKLIDVFIVFLMLSLITLIVIKEEIMSMWNKIQKLKGYVNSPIRISRNQKKFTNKGVLSKSKERINNNVREGYITAGMVLDVDDCHVYPEKKVLSYLTDNLNVKEWNKYKSGIASNKTIVLKGLTFEQQYSEYVDFSACQIKDCTFKSTVKHPDSDNNVLVALDFRSSAIKQCFFIGDLTFCSFDNAILERLIFSRNKEKIFGSSALDFDGIKIFSSSFKDTTLIDTKYKNCSIKECDFTGSNLKGVKFERSSIVGTNFLESHFSTKTKFNDCDEISDLLIDSSTLNNLNDDIGGLSQSQLSQMEIENHFVVLSSSFSGFKKIIHWIALILFFLPYLYFLIRCWLISMNSTVFTIPKYWSGVEINSSTTIGGLMIEYILSYGQMNGEISKFLLIPIFMLLFNVARGCIVLKTMNLELQQKITGLPVSFRFKKWVWWKFLIVKYGTYLYGGVSLVHFILFLNTPILSY